jgi:peptidyl-prolyl cis-trans isomerase B (cyclophilin B)
VYRLLLATLTLGVVAGTAGAANTIVVMETSMGNVKIELFDDKAPVTVQNFLKYVDDKHYDGTIFHRVIGKPNSTNDFMIQGGGFEPGLKEKPTRQPIKNEADNGVSNTSGTLAMARTSDPNSATAQFFINLADNPFLDRKGENAGYAVFGKVIEGMDVVNKIKTVKTGARLPNGQKVEGAVPENFRGHKDVPLDDVVIKSIRRVK